MATSTKHLNLTKPDPAEAGKTVTYNADLDKLEAGRTVRGLAGATIGAFQAVRYDGATDRWLLCDDDDVAVRGIAQAAAASGATVYVQVGGVVTNTGWAWVAGSEVFISATAGTLTQTAPAATSRPIGVALAATEALLYNNEHLERLRRGLLFDITNRLLTVVHTGSSIRGLAAEGYASAGNGGGLFLGRRSRGAEGAHVAVGLDDELAVLLSQGSDGTAFQNGPFVRMIASETWTGTARGSSIVFFTISNTTTALVERIRMTSAGDLLIGVTALTESFDGAGFGAVELRGRTAGGIYNVSTAAADADAVQVGQVAWKDRNATGDKTAAQIIGSLEGTTANNRGGRLRFATKANAGSVIDALIVDNAQRVKVLFSLSLEGDITPASLGVSQNDYNPASLAGAAVIRQASSAAVSITGLAGGSDGRLITIININAGGGSIITLTAEDAASAAANRFALAANVLLSPLEAITFWYDSTSSRWRPEGGKG